jgi:hypothetical protein
MKKIPIIIVAAILIALLSACNYTIIEDKPPTTPLYIAFFITRIDLEYGQYPTYNEFLTVVEESGYTYSTSDEYFYISVKDNESTVDESWFFSFSQPFGEDNGIQTMSSMTYKINGHELQVMSLIMPWGISTTYTMDDIEFNSYKEAENALFSEHSINYFETDGGKTMQGFIIFLGICGGILGIIMIVYFFKACVAAKKVSGSMDELIKINTEILKQNKSIYNLLNNKNTISEQENNKANTDIIKNEGE